MFCFLAASQVLPVPGLLSVIIVVVGTNLRLGERKRECTTVQQQKTTILAVSLCVCLYECVCWRYLLWPQVRRENCEV